MGERLTIGGIGVEVENKAIKNLHLTVHPPQGHVRIVAPERMQLDTIRLYALSKLPWLRRQIAELQAQARETSREYVNRESHFVWASRYLMKVVEQQAAPTIELRKDELVLTIRPGTDQAQRHEILAAWYRAQVRAAVSPLLAKWQRILKVEAQAIFVRQMKTKWGSCNPAKAAIRLNTDLAKKPPACLEYVLVHELAHLIEPTHSDRFRAILSHHLPNWPHLRSQLNRAPLAHEDWDY
ncbi:MAG: SprT family zinc-dependent metalloprotease [Polyangia bacterium]